MIGRTVTPGVLKIDQQERDAFLRLRLRVGAHQEEAPVRVVPFAAPRFLPIDEIVITLALRSGLERDQIRARVRLRESLRPEHIAAQDRRQMSRFLLSAAKRVQHRPEQSQSLPAQIGRVGEMAFPFEDMLPQRTPAGAAVLHRPVRRSPTLLVQRSIPGNEIFLERRSEAPVRTQGHVARQMLAQKLPHFTAKCFVFGAEFQVHLFNLVRSPATPAEGAVRLPLRRWRSPPPLPASS